MPFLNWRRQTLKQEVLPHSTLQNQLKLTLDVPSLAALVDSLHGTFERGEGELRLDLPQGWILFWKVREGDSRLLLAHPQKDEYVTTAALRLDHGQRVVADLRALQAGGEVRVAELGILLSIPSAGFSNTEIVIARG